MVARLSDPIIPYPYGTVPVFAPIPGNKLPGYFHNVPTGQRHLTPIHKFGATSRVGPTFEDEDENLGLKHTNQFCCGHHVSHPAEGTFVLHRSGCSNKRR